MYQTEEAVIQNLKDAGCDEAHIDDFMKEFHSGKINEAIRLLEIHRCSLLDALHISQKEIDCLDYLIFQIKRT